MTKNIKLLVYRNPGNGDIRYERYEIPISKGMSVLEALFFIQDHYDSTLAFRYACRGAICGSCGMTIDKVPMLACRVQVSNFKTTK
ncbi:MAG: 2Fe-2S iron-sulfur cluster-binding protein, partial [Promethearchaeota archaeon]